MAFYIKYYDHRLKKKVEQNNHSLAGEEVKVGFDNNIKDGTIKKIGYSKDIGDGLLTKD